MRLKIIPGQKILKWNFLRALNWNKFPFITVSRDLFTKLIDSQLNETYGNFTSLKYQFKINSSLNMKRRKL